MDNGKTIAAICPHVPLVIFVGKVAPYILCISDIPSMRLKYKYKLKKLIRQIQAMTVCENNLRSLSVWIFLKIIINKRKGYTHIKIKHLMLRIGLFEQRDEINDKIKKINNALVTGLLNTRLGFSLDFVIIETKKRISRKVIVGVKIIGPHSIPPKKAYLPP
jgi:hypothetical protein